MRHRYSAIFAASLAWSLCCIAAADERQDLAQLNQLMAKIEKLLPTGWEVAFEVSNDRWRRDAPLLVVRSMEKLPVEYIASMGRPTTGADPDPYIVQEPVRIEFEFTPFLTLQQFVAAKTRNVEIEKQRRHYEETRLKQQQSRYKGGFRPYNYERVTGDRSQLGREYAFLWLRTEPQRLPTHYFGNLAVETHDLPPEIYGGVSIKIHNPEKDAQYNEILDSLVKVFTPYQTQTE